MKGQGEQEWGRVNNAKNGGQQVPPEGGTDYRLEPELERSGACGLGKSGNEPWCFLGSVETKLRV